jgi:hypothetical protein
MEKAVIIICYNLLFIIYYLLFIIDIIDHQLQVELNFQ